MPKTRVQRRRKLEKWKRDKLDAACSRPWPPGPWDTEPDRELFESLGFQCMCLRGFSGAWCGYVGVDSTHPWYRRQDKEGMECASPVEITFSGTFHPDHRVKPRGFCEHLWWVGFHCGHGLAIQPRMEAVMLKYGETFGEISGFDRHYTTLEEIRGLVGMLAVDAARARLPLVGA